MEYIINFNKKTNTIKITTDHSEFLPKIQELLEDYKSDIIADINVSFNVDEMNKTVLCKNLNTNETSTMTYKTLTPEKILIWFHNICAMLENVEYTETVISYNENNENYKMFDEIIKQQIKK